MINKINPCPFCGGDKISVKTEILTKLQNGKNNVRAWAICQDCGHRSLSAFGSSSEEEMKEAALKEWNNSSDSVQNKEGQIRLKT